MKVFLEYFGAKQGVTFRYLPFQGCVEPQAPWPSADLLVLLLGTRRVSAKVSPLSWSSPHNPWEITVPRDPLGWAQKCFTRIHFCTDESGGKEQGVLGTVSLCCSALQLLNMQWASAVARAHLTSLLLAYPQPLLSKPLLGHTHTHTHPTPPTGWCGFLHVSASHTALPCYPTSPSSHSPCGLLLEKFLDLWSWGQVEKLRLHTLTYAQGWLQQF